MNKVAARVQNRKIYFELLNQNASWLETCRLKVAKIFPIENPRWQPWRTPRKSIFSFCSWTKRPIDLKLVRKYQGALQNKNTKIILIGHPGCGHHGGHLEILFLNFSWTKRPIDWEIGWKYWSDLQIKIAEIHGGHLENIFWTSHELKCQLTRNFEGSSGEVL